LKRLISSEKINVLVKMQTIPEVWRIFAEFGNFLRGVWRQTFISIRKPPSWCATF